jgi:hypothetical protein
MAGVAPTAGAAPAEQGAPSPAGSGALQVPDKCPGTYAKRHLPPVTSLDPKPGAPRVFAMQFKQEIKNVVSYGTFRRKVRCAIEHYVVPHLARNRPNVVVFTEDVGLMTLATGSRGASARATFGNPSSLPDCGFEGCAALAALQAIGAAYAPQVTAYQARYPGLGPLAADFAGPTDTLARGWMQTFSDMARRYDIYIAGSSTQAPFRESRDPADIATFADPDLPTPKSVYVATEGAVYNTAFLWGPKTVRPKAAKPLRNVVMENEKVPLTSLESALQVSPGPASGPAAKENLKPYHLPGTRAKLGFATSLPAFAYGNDFRAPPPNAKPCADVSVTYMRCLDHLGTNVVLQDEANPGRWADDAGSGTWQPLEWMGSTWRAVADRSVGFDYNVTPFMTGNLADLPFDGQSAITQRGRARGKGCRFVGNARFSPDPPEGDQPDASHYAGNKRSFIAMAPWVRDGLGRTKLRETTAKLAPKSGSPLENDYVETAVIADLPFPVDHKRRGCAGGRR